MIWSKLRSSFKGIEELLTLYQELDLKMDDFKRKVGIDCPEGCGECCRIPSKKIEVSLLEAIPLGIHLWENGEGEIFLERIYRMDQDSLCIFYRNSPSGNPKGFCYVYPQRPLICRLFGFSAILDKYGKPILVLCSKLRESPPEKILGIQSMVKKGVEVPINSSYARRVLRINPIYGQGLYPINEAIKMGLEVVGYRLGLFRESKEEGETLYPYDRAA